MKYILLWLMIFLIGCNNDGAPIDKKQYGSSIDLIEIDSCQYVLYSAYNWGSAMVHHGNCHNSVHKP